MPVIQHTVEGLKQAGVRQVHIATYHQAEQIREHFGTGEDFGLDVRLAVSRADIDHVYLDEPKTPNSSNLE